MSFLGTVPLSVSIMPATGEFEICEQDSLVVSGLIYCPEGAFQDRDLYPQVNEIIQGLKNKEVENVAGSEIKLTRQEVYKLLRLRGYDYGSTFQGISACSQDGECLVCSPYTVCVFDYLFHLYRPVHGL